MDPIGLAIDKRLQRAMANSILGEERLYQCGVCLDEGYLHRDKVGTSGKHEGALARFCEGCTRGLTIEAGHWASRLRGKRPAPKDVERFKQRQRQHPEGLRLRNLVDRSLTQPGAGGHD